MNSIASRFDKLVSASYKISKPQFNLIISLALLWGGLGNYLLICYLPVEWLNILGLGPILIIYFIAGLTGTLLLDKDRLIYTFAGFNLLVLATGLILSFSLQSVATDIINNFALYALLMTLLMLFVSLLLPPKLLTKKNFIAIALVAIVLIELVSWQVFGTVSNIGSLVILLLAFGGNCHIWAEANEEYDYSVGYCADLDFKLNDAISWGTYVYMGLFYLIINQLSKRESS